MIVVSDVAADERFAGAAEFLEKGIRSFAAAPLRSEGGAIIGAVCVLDSNRSEYDEGEQKWLEALGGEIVKILEAKVEASEVDHSSKARRPAA